MESARHQDLWRQLHRQVIQGLEEELERLRIRESDLQQSALERELVLLELLEVERLSRLAAEAGAGTPGAPDKGAGAGSPSRADAAAARAAELRSRLALTDPRIPELESALRAREELAHLRSRPVIRALYALVKLKRRVLGRR